MDLHTDFLIIGSGIAALRAAIELAGAGDVLVLTKGRPDEGSTGFAQGGIAAAVGRDDSPERHAADTMAAGDGLCDAAAVDVLVREGPRRVGELIAWGAAFDRQPDGSPALAREGVHSVARVLHARDATGREIGHVLWQRASESARIRIVPHAHVIELRVWDGCCVGAAFLDEHGRPGDAAAAATLLATGGAGQVYRETTNPAVATGDGIAIAYRAGARVADLEFVQFHPTVLAVEGAPRFLLSEALRGEGARLVNAAGERFMARYEPDRGELAPRDRVARAIVRERQQTGAPIYLTMDHLPAAYVRDRFPAITEACRRAGLDLARDRIPVGPAAHYIMGGVQTDLDGRTSLAGLFAAGEVACTGVHGANRLASNSLLEGLVFGARAGAAMRSWAPGGRTTAQAPTERRSGLPPQIAGSRPPSEADVRDLMWRQVGLFRDGEGLRRAVDVLDAAWRAWAREPDADPSRVRLASLVAVGRLIVRAALRREESRGAHYRTDFPHRDDIHWKRHVAETLEESS